MDREKAGISDSGRRLCSYSEGYSYDPTTGSLQSKGGLTYTYSTAHPHAVSEFNGNTYEYDANGNQIQRVIGADTFDLAYDAENRLVSVTGPNGFAASFAYDGDGQRVQSTIAGATTTFAGNYYEVSGGLATKYYYAGAARIAMRTSSSLYYLLGDHLGSTSLTTDASGNLISELKYTAWGEVRYQLGNTQTKYTYTGQYSNIGDFGLMFYNARWYDPYITHWAQPDTIVPNSYNSQDWNRYAYAHNNPLKYTDPSGHIPWPLIFVLLFVSTIPGDTGPYPPNPGSELIGDMAIRTFDPIDALYTGVECLSGECDILDVALAAAPLANGGMRRLADLAKAVERAQTAGQWINRAESMSDSSRAYQRFISGRTDDAVFKLNEYTFDGFDASRGVLQDAKNIPDSLIDPKTSAFKSWVSGTDDWLKQAYNQVSAADGLKIEWYFSTQAGRDAMYKLFLQKDPKLLKQIDLIVKPME